MPVPSGSDIWERSLVSTLRARCPHCRTLTAVAFDDGYECHSCGAAFAAGLVRVPRAWGVGGEPMAGAARIGSPYPEALVVDRGRVEEQAAVMAAGLPAAARARRLLLRARRRDPRPRRAHGRLAVVWLDAHGDLNTPGDLAVGERVGDAAPMAIDEGSVAPADVALVGRARPRPARAGVRRRARDRRRPRARARGRDAVYVALDVDVLEPGTVSCFMPVPGGPRRRGGRALRDVAARARGRGARLAGLAPDAEPAALARFAAAAGL